MTLGDAGTAGQVLADVLAAECGRSGERGAVALVLFGGLEYRQASRVLAIPPAEMAASLRTAMHRLTTTADVALSLPET